MIAVNYLWKYTNPGIDTCCIDLGAIQDIQIHHTESLFGAPGKIGYDQTKQKYQRNKCLREKFYTKCLWEKFQWKNEALHIDIASEGKRKHKRAIGDASFFHSSELINGLG